MIFESLKGEEFAFVPDGYLISNMGRAYSLKMKKFLIGRVTYFGYRDYIFHKDSVPSRFFANRLVAKYFLPTPNEDKIFVNHINSNKQDNRVENLEWCTPKENVKHYHENNPKALNSLSNIKDVAFSGEQSGMSKLTNKDVFFIRSSGINGYALSKILNVAPTTVYSVLNNQSWKHLIKENNG